MITYIGLCKVRIFIKYIHNDYRNMINSYMNQHWTVIILVYDWYFQIATEEQIACLYFLSYLYSSVLTNTFDGAKENPVW